jgi:hypothetical protein
MPQYKADSSIGGGMRNESNESSDMDKSLD